MFHIYTGEGKGKSTASIGLALRAVGSGLRVFYHRMLKPRWKTGELKLLPNIHPNLIFRNVKEDWILSRSKNIEEHVKTMRSSLENEINILENAINSGDYDMVIADEINYCINRKLISLDKALTIQENCPKKVELIFTGRYANPELIKKADLVTEMKKVKHYFDKGIRARKGIEF